ncbi:hypothetical protein P8605_46945 [Streptomyces sp. T-3]|nr:hypothetical protein [Streptomyces sp. T-3]
MADTRPEVSARHSGLPRYGDAMFSSGSASSSASPLTVMRSDLVVGVRAPCM